MAQKYSVTLADDERRALQQRIHAGTWGVRKVTRVHILLLADEGNADDEIAKALHTSLSIIHRTRQRFVEEGFDEALTERRRSGASVKLTGRDEAFLVALACSAPPAGRTCGTMGLLAERLMELHRVGSIADETIRLRLKKTG